MAPLPDSRDNPLLSENPGDFDRLIEAVGPASMLVLIRARMSARLRGRLEPEDIWQEALVHAWRDRARCEWKGVRVFRRWLIQIIENRLRDAGDREGALKRGGGGMREPLENRASSAAARPGATPDVPLATTTPSRVAMEWGLCTWRAKVRRGAGGSLSR